MNGNITAKDSNILVVGQNRNLNDLVVLTLDSMSQTSGESYFVKPVENTEAAKPLIAGNYWDLILYDLESPKRDSIAPESFKALADLVKLSAPTPILVFNPHTAYRMVDEGHMQQAVSLGAADEVPKPNLAEVLFKSRINTYLKAVHGQRDGLTGLLNKGVFHERIEEEYARVTREYEEWKKRGLTARKLGLSAAFVDFDDFKQFNTAHGHLGADKTLRYVGEKLSHKGRLLRHPEVACRYGGDEFALMFVGPHTHDEIITRLHYVFSDITHTDIGSKLEQSEPVYVGMSVGVSTYPAPNAAPTVSELISASDRAMYFAKKHRSEKGLKGSGYTIFGFEADCKTPVEKKPR